MAKRDAGAATSYTISAGRTVARGTGPERWRALAPIGDGIGRLIYGRRGGRDILLPDTDDDAALMVHAPEMYKALLAIVREARECGYYEQRPYHPKAGCACGECLALRALVRIEGGGRCVLCACSQYDACGDGCAWADSRQTVCTAHPPKMI